MARIRSVHPGFFTDEELVSVSMAARLLVIGLGIDADDKGIFEWKPLTIKMKVFPADNVDIAALLSELEEARAVRRYEHDGRSYGAIRNFRKFQRPKTPNDIHPAPGEIRNYVGLGEEISETLPQSGGNASEIRRQMEDGGDKGIEERSSNEDSSLETNDPPLTETEILEAWETRMVPQGFPAVRKMTITRKRQLKARLRDSTIDEWQQAMAALERSAFCRGENDRGWRADFDFLLQPKSFTKLLEGAYDH